MRYLFAVFFFLSLLLSLPDHSQAATPPGVIQMVKVAGTYVAVPTSSGPVGAIIPAAAAVGTASAAGVTTPGVVPLVVGGIALAGGYAVGASLVTDIPALRDLVERLPDKYQALKDAFAPPVDDSGDTPVSTLNSGDIVASTNGAGNWVIVALYATYDCPPTYIVNGSCAVPTGISCAMGYCYVKTTNISPQQYQYTAYQTVSSPTVDPLAPSTPAPISDADAAANMSTPDGTLTPEADADIKSALASGDVTASGVTGSSDSGTLAGQPLTPELLEAFGRTLAQQAATTAASQTVQQLQDALAADPTNATLAQQLSQAQAELAEAQAAQAAAEAAAAEATAAADTATANLGPANTYDATINTPESKNITGLMNTFFDNSPLLGIVRSFQISTTDQQALFSFGTFWGQEITVDFTRWQSVLAGCGVVLLVLSHAYAVFIVVRG